MRELKEETGVFLKHFMYKRQNEKIVIKKGKQQHHYFVIDVAVPPLVSIDNYEITDYRWATLDWICNKKVSYFTAELLTVLKDLEMKEP